MFRHFSVFLFFIALSTGCSTNSSTDSKSAGNPDKYGPGIGENITIGDVVIQLKSASIERVTGGVDLGQLDPMLVVVVDVKNNSEKELTYVFGWGQMPFGREQARRSAIILDDNNNSYVGNAFIDGHDRQGRKIKFRPTAINDRGTELNLKAGKSTMATIVFPAPEKDAKILRMTLEGGGVLRRNGEELVELQDELRFEFTAAEMKR